MAHGEQALDEDQSEEHPDRVRHLLQVALDGDDVPEKTSQSQQGKVQDGDRHHQDGGSSHLDQVRPQERKEASVVRHSGRA